MFTEDCVCNPTYWNQAAPGAALSCFPCSEGCVQCTNANGSELCEECSDGYDLVNGICELMVPGFYRTPEGFFMPCMPSCHTCTDSVSCFSCAGAAETLNESTGQCELEECPSGYFINADWETNPSSGLPAGTPAHCSQCSGAPKCLECSDRFVCTQCYTGSNLVSHPGGEVGCECPFGFTAGALGCNMEQP